MKYLILVVLLFSVLSIKAQKGMYLEFGYNASQFASFSDEEHKFLYSPQVSLNVYRPIVGNTLKYHLGVGYQRYGGKYSAPLISYQGQMHNLDLQCVIHSLKLPLIVEYYNSGFQVFAGLYASRNYSGKFKSNFIIGYGEEEGYNQLEGDLVTERWHAGYSFGLGYKHKRWSLALRYEEGFKSLRKEGIFVDNKNLDSLFRDAFLPSNTSYLGHDSEAINHLKLKAISLNLAFHLY